MFIIRISINNKNNLQDKNNCYNFVEKLQIVNNRVGEKYITNEGFKIEIIEYFSALNCTIKFEDGCIIKNTRYDHIKEGAIKNPNKKSVFGVGFFGHGEYRASVKYKSNRYYTTWTDMFRRCYDKKFQEKFSTYKDCTVVEEWHNFQNFAKWFEENWEYYMDGWQLDKDVLIKGNKAYSPDACCFVSSEINNLFIKSDSKRGEYPIGVTKVKGGKYRAQIVKNNKVVYLGTFKTIEEAFQVYKTAKEQYIKEIADKYKNLIDKKVYQALINYKVEITD